MSEALFNSSAVGAQSPTVPEVEAFESQQFGSVRTVVDGGRVLFCGRDVATALGYENPGKAIRDHCKGGPFRYPLQTAGGVQRARFISEGDLYRLIASSKLPQAVRFESWVFDEVLPSIRLRGRYAFPLSGQELMARAVLEAQATIERISGQVQQLKPKAEGFDVFLAARGDYSVRDAAQILNRAGAKTGQNRLFKRIKALRWAQRLDSGEWRAYQKAIEAEYLTVRATSYEHPHTGARVPTKTLRITPKGIARLGKHLGVLVEEEHFHGVD